MMKWIRILILFFWCNTLLSQQVPQQNNIVKVFALEDYLQWVKSNHPLLKQASLLNDKAKASLLESKGLFDPKLNGNYEHKTFDDKNYFKTAKAGLKIPTWYGIDVNLGYQWANGEFLNNEDFLPSNGQAVIGVDVPLIRGLLFDQRRAQVQQARLFFDANEATRQSMVNDLLLDAIESYWKWAYHYEVVKIFEASLSLSEDRFSIIRESFLLGDKPAIDTLESLIVLENRQQQLREANIGFQNATLEVSNYLWEDDLVPLEISDALIPEKLNVDDLQIGSRIDPLIYENVKETHPQLQAITVKQQQLEIKERLKREQFKPDLRFKYNFLGDGFNFSGEPTNANALSNVLLENYKLGLQFNYPLLLRKERGGLQLVKLEQLENEYKLEFKALKIQNKIKSIFQELNTKIEQQSAQSSIESNYISLLNAENEKFRVGESSIFLINNREQKLIEAQLKLLKLTTDLQKLIWKLEWAKGNIS